MENLAEAIERVLAAPCTLEELVRELKKCTPELDESSVTRALANGLKAERLKCKDFDNASVTLYFAEYSVSDVTCDVKQPEIQNELTSSSGIRVARPYPKRPAQLSGRVRMPFHSPARQLCGGAKHPSLLVKNGVDQLKNKSKQLDEEISSLSEIYSEDELKEHIDMLHQYNEIKDTGQTLLGKLAELKGTTTKAMYEEFGLSLDD
jgi:hypothetical protein